MSEQAKDTISYDPKTREIRGSDFLVKHSGQSIREPHYDYFHYEDETICFTFFASRWRNPDPNIENNPASYDSAHYSIKELAGSSEDLANLKGLTDSQILKILTNIQRALYFDRSYSVATSAVRVDVANFIKWVRQS